MLELSGFNEIITPDESFCEMTLSKTFATPITNKENTDKAKAATQMAYYFLDALLNKNPETKGQVNAIAGYFEDNEHTIILSLKLINGLMSKEIVRKSLIGMSEQ